MESASLNDDFFVLMKQKLYRASDFPFTVRMILSIGLCYVQRPRRTFTTAHIGSDCGTTRLQTWNVCNGRHRSIGILRARTWGEGSMLFTNSSSNMRRNANCHEV